MSENTKFNAAILIIGNEILSGRTQDTNTSTLATWLNSLGVKVGEVRIIPDVEETIVSSVNLLRKNYNYVFTSGGIGPTHDDITSESVSKAFNLPYEKHEEGYEIYDLMISLKDDKSLEKLMSEIKHYLQLINK